MTEHDTTPTENLTLTDDTIFSIGKVLSENITLTDSIIRGKIFSETLTLSDGDTLGPEIVLEETLTLTDTFSYVLDATINLTETLTLTDSHNEGIGRELTEAITLTDGDISDLSEMLTSTNGAWTGIYVSRIYLADSIQDFINRLDAQQIPINMMEISCHAAINDDSTIEFNIVAVIKKH